MKKAAKEWLDSLKHAVIALIVLFFVCWPFQVTGNSMAEALQPGDRIAVSRLLAYVSPPVRGEIVICNFFQEGVKKTVVKRVVAVPGDYLSIKNGGIFLNDNEYIAPSPFNDNIAPQSNITLSKDEYFMVGDNSDISLDSRQCGPVKRKHIIARIIARWYPFNEFTFYYPKETASKN